MDELFTMFMVNYNTDFHFWGKGFVQTSTSVTFLFFSPVLQILIRKYASGKVISDNNGEVKLPTSRLSDAQSDV